MDSARILTDAQRQFLERRRVAHLATADAAGQPHVVPVCFALSEYGIHIAIDRKPKRGSARRLKRLRNIAENPRVALLADVYDDRDWSRLGWVMVRGRAEILDNGAEYQAAQARLKERYPQLAAMDLSGLPVIAIRIEQATGWGALAGGETDRT